MSQHTHSNVQHTHNFAEGAPDELNEHDIKHDSRRTSLMPPVEPPASIGQTGIFRNLSLSEREGRDANDWQDASLTRSETEPNLNLSVESMENQNPVLIVEDTVELAEVIQATLEGMGLEAVYATHGSVGLERLKEAHPPLVLLDIGLPDISGWKMLEYIKSHCDDAGVEIPPIIVITAYGDPANRLIGKLQKIHSYLIKPFTPDQVENVVTMALNGEYPTDPNIGGETTTGR